MSEETKKPAYQVLARRFRPQTFDEVVGQEAVLTSLRQALACERVPHAFLFSGSRGVGKTTLARIVARALNCEMGPGPNPCGACHSCTSILAGNNADVVEIDAASHNLVDDIRELRERVGFVSMGSRYKVYILDEVHMLTRSAFNAFLKTLEEPPPRVVFVLATTELHKVPETIRSRCQVLMFHRVGEIEIAKRLAMICEHEGLAVSAEILQEIAASARGGMRDAETALERILPIVQNEAESFDLDAFHRLFHRVGPGETIAVVKDLLVGETRLPLRFVDTLCKAGMDEREALGEVLQVLRAILMIKLDGQDTGLLGFSGSLRASLIELSQDVEVSRLDAMIQAGLLGRERIRRLDDRRLVLELSLLRMAMAAELPVLADLVEAVQSGAGQALGGTLPGRSPAPVGKPQAPRSAQAKLESQVVGDLRARLLVQLKSAKPMLVSTVELCEISGPEQGMVALTLHSDLKMHRDRLALPEIIEVLRNQIEALVGGDIRLQVQTSALSVEPESAPPAEADAMPEKVAKRPAAGPGPEIRRVAERFDGQTLELDD